MNRKIGKDSSPFQNGRNTCLDNLGGLPSGDVLAIEFDLSLIGFHQSDDGLHRRRFAAGIPSKEADQLSLFDLEVDAF